MFRGANVGGFGGGFGGGSFQQVQQEIFQGRDGRMRMRTTTTGPDGKRTVTEAEVHAGSNPFGAGGPFGADGPFGGSPFGGSSGRMSAAEEERIRREMSNAAKAVAAEAAKAVAAAAAAAAKQAARDAVNRATGHVADRLRGLFGGGKSPPAGKGRKRRK